MRDFDPWLRFALAALATWRITHLLAREDGPGDILFRWRRSLGDGFFGKLLDCFYCLSVWVALPLAFFVTRTFTGILLTWPALSGAACLLERLGHEPVVFHPLNENSEQTEREESHELLRSKTHDPETGTGPGSPPPLQ